MRDVQPGEVRGFVGPRLPDVVPEDLPCRPEDDMGRAVVPHQGGPAGPVDLACHGLPSLERRLALHEVEDDVPDPLHVHDIPPADRAAVRLLPAPLRIEERLVQEDGASVDGDDLRAELLLPPVLVHPQSGWREVRRKLNPLRPLGGDGTLVLAGDLGEEVVGDLDAQGRELLHDVRGQPVAVVQLNQRSEPDGLAPRGPDPLLETLHRASSLLQGIAIPLLLHLQELQDVPLVEEQLRVVLAVLVDQEADRVRHRVRDVQVPEGAQPPPDQEAGEVPLAGVRRDDTVPEEEHQGAGVVADHVQRLERRELGHELLHGDPEPGRGLRPDRPDVRRGLDVEHPGDLRVLREDPGVHLLRARGPLQVREGVAEHGLVRGGRPLREPHEPLEPVSRVHDGRLHRHPVPVRVPVLHEHEGRGLRPAEDDLEAGPAVPPALPPALLVPDEPRVHSQPLHEEAVAQLHGPVLPVDRLAREVERVVGHHLEQGEVLPGLPDVVDVHEPDAGLGDHEGVRGRARLPADHPRLERVHARLREEDVFPPAGDDRVPPHAGVAVRLHEGDEVLPHRADREALLERRVPDEVVLLTGPLPADRMVSQSPEELPARGALETPEALSAEELDLVFALGHSIRKSGAQYKGITAGSRFSPAAAPIARHASVVDDAELRKIYVIDN